MPKVKDVQYLKYNLILLRMAALLKLEKNKNFYQILLHHIWRFILRTAVGFTFVAIFIDITHKLDQSFDDSIMNYMYFGGNFYFGWRINYYYYFDDTSEKFINDLNKVFKYQSQTGFKEKNMSRIVQIAKWMSLSWFWMAFFTAQTIFISQIIFGGYSKKILSIPAWYPYNYSVSPYYELTVIFQMLNQVSMIIVVSATDTFFASTSLMMAKQFEILSWEIKNLFYTNLLRWGISKEKVIQFKEGLNGHFHRKDEDPSIRDVIDNPKFHDDLLRNFNNLIKFHKALTSLSTDMENFFSPLILMYFIPIAIIMMPFAYSLITTHNLMTLVEDILAGIWLLCEVLFLSYFGELITEKSEEVHTSLYDIPWYFCDRKFMNSFKIIHQRTNTPVTLTVGKFKNLGLNMFLWTLKTVYSFTTLLRNVNQRI